MDTHVSHSDLGLFVLGGGGGGGGECSGLLRHSDRMVGLIGVLFAIGVF